MIFPYGFRIVGGLTGKRQLIDWAAAFSGYAACQDNASVDREAYLSAFTFGPEFYEHVVQTGSTRRFSGPCHSAWLWFDLDGEGDLDRVTVEARQLTSTLLRHVGVDGDELLIFFSGSKGFHIGLPLAVCDSPAPGEVFHLVCRQLAENLAAEAQVSVDVGIYDRVRAFRAPNSRHPKTGLHKRCLTFRELHGLNVTGIQQLATGPQEFDIPNPSRATTEGVTAWRIADEQVRAHQIAMAELRAQPGSMQLNRLTLEFLRGEVRDGERHRRLFSAAANLGEFGCPPELAHALLTPTARDSGLTPSDIRRQIDSGLSHASSNVPS